VAEGKGGWIAEVYKFPSTMAQNFWIAIFAWSTCFLVTMLVSLATKPRPEAELKGLVYGLTEMPVDQGERWYRRPLPLACVVGCALLLLNLWFW
jgi:SSS family solute:Na+ symporter